MADHQTIDAELHAHAQQLLEFCRKHNLGFVVMLVESDHEVHAVSNLDNEQKIEVAQAFAKEPLFSSFHKPAAKG